MFLTLFFHPFAVVLFYIRGFGQIFGLFGCDIGFGVGGGIPKLPKTFRCGFYPPHIFWEMSKTKQFLDGFLIVNC